MCIRDRILTDHLYAFTCAIFFRRHIFANGVRFNAGMQSVADGLWVAEALRNGHRFALVHEYLSTFVMTGKNRSQEAISREEDAAVRAELPAVLRWATPGLRAFRHVEKLLAGAYRSGPITYEVYPDEDARERQRFVCEKPSFRFPKT